MSVMNIYFDRNYPKNLVKALDLIHSIYPTDTYNIIWGDKVLSELDKDQTVVFLFDRAKKGIEITTELHYEDGYRIFAFMTRTTEKTDLFRLSLRVLTLWKKILGRIKEENNPFIFTYGYKSKRLRKVII